MIDYFSLALSHGLLLLCLFRIARNKMLDPVVPRPQRRQKATQGEGSPRGGAQQASQKQADDAA